MTALQKSKLKRNLFIFCFICIPVGLMLIFTYYPAAKLLMYSFTNYDGLSKKMDFVGLMNWKQLLGDAASWKTLGNCVYYIVGGLIQNALALLLAIILNNDRIKGKNIFRGLVFLPFVINGTAVSYMFRYLYDFTKGPLNLLAQTLGFEAVSWLGNEKLVNWSLAFVCLWRYTGYLMIIYLAALQSVPKEYYEASMIDGCNSFGRLRYITLPQISSVLKLQMFLNISGAVNIFDIPFVMTGGGPVNASETLAMRANEYAFSFKNYGMASAYGVFCTVMIVILYVTQNKILYREEN